MRRMKRNSQIDRQTKMHKDSQVNRHLDRQEWSRRWDDDWWVVGKASAINCVLCVLSFHGKKTENHALLLLNISLQEFDKENALAYLQEAFRCGCRGRVRPSVGPSVHASTPSYFQMTSFPVFQWGRNTTWTKRNGITILQWVTKK